MTDTASPKSIFKTIILIHTALAIGLIAFAAFVYVKNGNFIAEINSDNVFTFIVPLIAISGYFASIYLFRVQTSKINSRQNLIEKLTAYQKAHIVRLALIEGPAFLSFIAYHLSGSALFLVIGLCLIAYFITLRPTITKINEQLSLTREEQRALEN